MTTAFETHGIPVDGGYTLEDLRALASRLRIAGRSGMAKSELIGAINETLDERPKSHWSETLGRRVTIPED